MNTGTDHNLHTEQHNDALKC